MSERITIRFKAGRPPREFSHQGRAGGSYSISLKFDGGFAIVENEYGRRWAFPSEDIEEIEETPLRGGW